MSRSARLAELKALRASGKTRLSTYKVQEEERLYEEVDEEGYKRVVRDRLDRDDFVIDDNGQGYADDGREEWIGEKQYDSVSGSDEELPVRGKAAKRKREEEKEKTEKTNNSINRYFNNGPVAVVAKPKPAATADDAAFMANLLGEVDTNIPSRLPIKAVKIEARRKVRILSPPMESRSFHSSKSNTGTGLGQQFSIPPAESAGDDGNDYIEGFEEDGMGMEVIDDLLPSSPIQKAVERKGHIPIKVEENEDDEMDIAQAIGDQNAKVSSVNICGSRPPTKLLKKDPSSYPTPESSSPTRPINDEVDPSTWNDVNLKLNVLNNPATLTTNPGKLRVQDAIEDDGSLRFFWTDYTEVNGSLCLFGKVKDRSLGGLHVSAFVKVDNILRKLFFLPRVYKQRHGRDTSKEVEMQDVYQEVDELMTKLRVGMHKIKPCSRKYAFELPDIPKEADYLKLMYPHDKPTLPSDLKGESFSCVFGTNTALFEQFVLWKNIMGPCWLTIEADKFLILNNASWCKFEIQLASPKSIKPLSEAEAMDVPPLTIMSLALRTTLNVKENKQEILVVSARIYENVSLTDPTPPDKLPCTTFTLIRPSETSFPVGFDAACKKQKRTVILEKSEQLLLSRFLALLEKMDPDVLMGHQLQDVDYPILLSRMRERKTPGWHRIGRLRRSEWPRNIGKGGNSFFAERQLVSGRLLCDIANDMGKSLMTKCQSWNLTEMCELYLCNGNIRQEVDNEIALKTWATAKGLSNYINDCEADTYFIAAIALRVQMLPLTKVLTNLAGNSWARTLSGTRAERNEYILLHEFHRNKYICPDKIWGKGKQKVEDESLEGEEGVDVKKKDKFKGGLVFEPEKGLYDKFILVMDFNSLYPSIIQEYNICFTTVDRSDQVDDEEKVPEVPSDQNQGILPKLIATLVSRRREVKKLMKDKRATPEQLATWDIKQLALKLTANSMYGCLGYTQSRFYARPLAMLTTFKGREILRSTKELAEGNQLQVIYGDTDSVMINTNADNMEEALKVGNEFKRLVNDRYKLLEIDIDNVFRRLLLHAKKKYAAINLVEVDGKYVDKLEVKGLDMKRREYCALSKDASSRLLTEILSGDDSEVVVGKVHEYLRELAQQMREERIPNQKFIIYTKLGKDPRSYPSPDSMPQVQVALRALAAGKSARVNDVISYITTAPTATSSEAAAKRAFSPLDVQKSAGELKPDIDWYLAKQIFPPIERLCAPIDGTDAGQLAECLGLDPKKYALSSAVRAEGSVQDITPLESQLPDEIRYKDCARLQLTCITCKHKFPFLGIASSLSSVTPKGIVCPAEGCGNLFKMITLVAQTEHAIRVLASEYYDGWLVCDDPSCGARTRSMSVYGHRCLGPNGLAHGCLGRMGWEKSGRGVGSTLGFWRGIWDVEKVMTDGVKGVKMEDKERVKALVEWNRERFETVKGVVEGYVKQCGWVWVQMDSLFGFALR
ncbi:DNA-directed DNA polymerase alpha catalytic subunit pol1 [Xylographa soralifera]|nr:DNA-directed DNA polymerase alpha catalytic subunit pol1 [Xylographa soralifera]